MLTYEEQAARIVQLESAAAALRAELDQAVARVAELVAQLGHDGTGGLTVAEFTRRLAPVFLALGTKGAELGAKWDRVFSLLAGFTVVYPTRQPVAGLVAAAVADGLLTADQAAALAAG